MGYWKKYLSSSEPGWFELCHHEIQRYVMWMTMPMPMPMIEMLIEMLIKMQQAWETDSSP